CDSNGCAFNGGGISVLLGNGNGTFKPKVDYATNQSFYSVVAIDVNGDNKLDLVTAGATFDNNFNNTGAVSILVGNGNGTFQSPVNYADDGSPYAIAVADFNGDGKPDVVTNSSFSSARVRFNNGDGTLGPPADYFTNGADFLATGDLNGDSKPDIAMTGYNVTALLNAGDGTFLSAAQIMLGSEGAPNSVVMRDFNNDGKFDLAVTKRNNN